MSRVIEATIAGFLIGFLTTPAAVMSYADMPIERVRSAEEVCINANSKLVSLDRVTATCANKAEIPYEVKK